jgi:DNA-binding transcriptional regulator YiaG
MTPNQKKLVSNLNAFIDRNRLTQKQAACIMSASERTMRRWLAGDTVPPGVVSVVLEVFESNPAAEQKIVGKYLP